MCGIAGVFNLDGQPVLRKIIQEITRVLSHRGPDGEGFFFDHNLGFGHRRLAILDVSEKGAQPMISHDNKWVIVFNGCIYNFPSLKKELQALGHTFVSAGDTEVICEGLAHFGQDFFKRLNGMFAIAAWHKPTKSLYLTRDRFGIKPLYF